MNGEIVLLLLMIIIQYSNDIKWFSFLIVTSF
jgi:hypothetical protein